ncbi:MAG TPA: DUF1186 domain-containing protein [Anaerolineae bacterium]|nr:DUF1186 domain-containing protein [Anaerolineae bacterium]
MKKLSPEIIRQQTFLQFTDLQLFDAAAAFSRDTKRQIAIYEAILRSPEHSPDLLNYGEIYFEVGGSVVPFRGFQDNLATFYAWFAYGVQHDYPEDIFEAAQSVILEYLDQDHQQALETGLRILIRFIRAFSPPLAWAVWILDFLNERDQTVELGNHIFEELMTRFQSHPRAEEAADLLEEYLGQEVQAPQKSVSWDANLVEELVNELSKLSPTVSDSDEISFTIQPSLRALLAPEEGMTPPPRPEEAVLELIYLALNADLAETPEADMALQVLQQWHQEGLALLQELAPWLEKAQGNWRALLTDRVCKVGFLTPDELKALVSDIQADVFLRSDATEALIEIAQRMPSLEPDIKDFVRYLLTRAESREVPEEETFLAFAISALLDAQWRDLLPEIEAAFKDDVVDPEVVQLKDVSEAWGVTLDVPERMPEREDGEYILLRCTQCGRSRHHFVRKILLDLGTLDRKMKGLPIKYDPYVMDHEIICPKCGARDAYEVNELVATRLLAMAFPDTEPPEKIENEGDLFATIMLKAVRMIETPLKVYPVHSATRTGLRIHPLALRDRYLANIEKNPKDPANYVSLANVYKNVFRDEEALVMARKAHELAPDNMGIVLLRAMAEHDAGDPEMAQKLYTQIIERSVGKGWGWGDDFELVATARDGLQALKQGKPSPWIEGSREVLSASALSTRSEGTKRRKKKRKKKKKKR